MSWQSSHLSPSKKTVVFSFVKGGLGKLWPPFKLTIVSVKEGQNLSMGDPLLLKPKQR